MILISAFRSRSGRERGFSLIELVIATLVLSVGLMGLARLFVLATLNSALAVNMSQGLNDAQRLLEVYKTEAATNGAASATIVSGTYSATDASSAYYNAMLVNSGTGYRSAEFQEDVWVFDESGTLVTGTYPTSPALPPGYSAGDLHAPSSTSRLVYIRMTPKVPDPRFNQIVTLMTYVRSS
jgi:prepilin-type N-terminal cleavage/methylation domain-containing protein